MEESKPIIKKRKYLFTVIILLLIVIAGATFFYKKILYQKKNQIQNSSIEGEAILNLEYGGEQRWFSGNVKEGMTFLNALETASVAGKFNLHADSQIVSVDNFTNNASSSWVCYLNGSEVKEPLSKKNIYSKDKLLCQYKKNNLK